MEKADDIPKTYDLCLNTELKSERTRQKTFGTKSEVFPFPCVKGLDPWKIEKVWEKVSQKQDYKISKKLYWAAISMGCSSSEYGFENELESIS